MPLQNVLWCNCGTDIIGYYIYINISINEAKHRGGSIMVLFCWFQCLIMNNSLRNAVICDTVRSCETPHSCTAAVSVMSSHCLMKVTVSYVLWPVSPPLS